ncbi:putative RNA-directed DNA polymerase from mobile element jockey-like 71 [Homarus americanus]|uniref:Putative RNA-directed DNA polymerase from mobile element jockey-like 71 n=1 Tax=Homarus americanus TaxID=6706 RepID=A0A8J5JQN2_HOMAM|nr:putative RNA-directed DNA polymerase from mobile element jockey-like 71 [Homarus americanus]
MFPTIHPVTEPPTFAIPTVMKYKIPKETEFNHAHEVVVALELEYKNIKFSVKPNLVGDLILFTQDHNTAKILSEVTNLNGKTVKIIPLDPEEKTTRMVLLRYPLGLPVEVIIKHPKVTKAEHCVTSQDKAQTRHVLVYIKGTDPEEVDLSNWGTYKLRPFVPEPLRCYRCQKFGHHQSRCHKKVRCGICSQTTENSHPNTYSAPTVRGFLPCTSSTRLQDKIEDTGTKSVHAGNHDKSLDSTTAAPELYSSKSTEHSSIGGKHHIAWDTATPSGDYPTEHTPACQSTSGIHIRTNKTDDHRYDSDFLYYNKETRYQHRKFNKCSYDTAHRKDAGRPDPKTPQLQVEQTTPLSQISDKKKNLPSERSLKTVKPLAPRNRSRGIEQQAQTVSKHTITGKSDSTLKREEKIPEIPPKTSGIPSPAPPLDQVPKKQPPFLTDEEESESTMNAENNYSTSDKEIMIE